MKNWSVAELGSPVRAIAIVPRTFFSLFAASLGIGGSVAGIWKSDWKCPPWIMKPGITRWNVVPK